MSSSDRSALAEILEAMGDAHDVSPSPEEVQRLLSIAVKSYVSLIEEGHQFVPLASSPVVNGTEVVATVSAMLDQVDIEVFELAMWQSWGRV